MNSLEPFVRELCAEDRRVLAVGDTPRFALPIEAHAQFPAEQERSYDALIWSGASDRALDAARRASGFVKAGGAVLLSSQARSGPLSAMRALFASSEAQRHHVEELCEALLLAGLEQPELLLESTSLTVVRAFVRSEPRVLF